jgi:hypothetical protein
MPIGGMRDVACSSCASIGVESWQLRVPGLGRVVHVACGGPDVAVGPATPAGFASTPASHPRSASPIPPKAALTGGLSSIRCQVGFVHRRLHRRQVFDAAFDVDRHELDPRVKGLVLSPVS